MNTYNNIQSVQDQTDSTYGEDTIESAREKATSLGLVVVFPEPHELFVDIDSKAAMKRFCRAIGRLPGVTYLVRPSPSGRPGRFHIVVTMPGPVGAMERIALQAMLGSDPTRELLSWMRTLRGITQPTLFFERPATIQ
jgi:hypothetical protein